MALPLGDFTDPLAVRALEPQITEATPGEVQGANIASHWYDNYLVKGATYNQRAYNTPYVDPEAPPGAYADAPINAAPQVDPADAKAQAKAAGVDIPFDKPMIQPLVQGIIDDHVSKQQRDEVISRNGNSILSGQVGRFVTGGLVDLADPLKISAMMIPAAPEAMVAASLAKAASVFERGAIRGLAGAANGAVGMAALEPLNYAMDKADYNDWIAGDALRNIFMGAALGAGGHMLMGGLFGREHLDPNTSMEATRAAIGQAIEDRPVDVGGIAEVARATRAADDLQKHSAPVAPEGIDAFHGTPHEFDSFDIGAIGTGEGAQAYGHGLYFAEQREIADGYRKKLSGRTASFDGKISPDLKAALAAEDNLGFDSAGAAVAAMRSHPDWAQRWDVQNVGPLQDAFAAHEDRAFGGQGNLYHVKLNADDHHFLDWDAPVEDQPQGVVDIAKRMYGDTYDPEMRGETVYKDLARANGGVEQANAVLQRNGIKGTRYLDGNSRAMGEGSRNYVMFDHKDVQITHKNGVPVADAVADLRAQAQTAASDMAKRAMDPPTDPVIDRADRLNKASVDSAPKITGDVDKDLAEATKMVQDLHQQLQAEIASGRIAKTQEFEDRMTEADHTENEGKAAAGYAACLAGRGVV